MLPDDKFEDRGEVRGKGHQEEIVKIERGAGEGFTVDLNPQVNLT